MQGCITGFVCIALLAPWHDRHVIVLLLCWGWQFAHCCKKSCAAVQVFCLMLQESKPPVAIGQVMYLCGL